MISERIKKLRENKGWTQTDLAKELGITRNGVNSWEQGLSTPSPASLVDLALKFNVTTDYLLGLSDLKTLNVEGLSDEDISCVSHVIERLRSK